MRNDMSKEEADKATKMLGRQIVDEIMIFLVLLFTWFFRAHLQSVWSMAGIFTLVLILGVDYVIHNPKLSKKRSKKREGKRNFKKWDR